MFTVILADGLTEDVLSSESQHLSQKANVGRREIFATAILLRNVLGYEEVAVS